MAKSIIHIVLGKANPQRLNGVSKVAHHLALYMQEADMPVQVWGIAERPETGTWERSYRMRFFRSMPSQWKVDPDLLAAIDTLGQDAIYHFHGAFITRFLGIIRYLINNNIEYVYSPHGAYSKIAMGKNGFMKKIYFKLFEAKIIKYAKCVHLMGINQYNDLDELITAENKVVIPNGQNMDELPTPRTAEKDGDEIQFIFCGRLVHYYKGLDMLLKGFAQYRDQGGKGSLSLIGDGIDRTMLEKMADQLKVRSSITFHGAMFGEDKLKTLQNADVFVHPSRSEGSPTAVLEAAGLGLPCLVSQRTNVGELVEKYNAGIYIQPNTPETIAEAMSKFELAKREGQLAAQGIGARKMVEEEFDWTKIVKLFEEIYFAA